MQVILSKIDKKKSAWLLDRWEEKEIYSMSFNLLTIVYLMCLHDTYAEPYKLRG